MKRIKKLLAGALALAASVSLVLLAACSEGEAPEVLREGLYVIQVLPNAQGEVVAERFSADPHEVVTIWAKPGKQPVVVNDETGSVVALTTGSDKPDAEAKIRLGSESVTAYSFLMPESDVTIKLLSDVEASDYWVKSVAITDIPAEISADPHVFINDGQPGASTRDVSVETQNGAGTLRVTVDKGGGKTLSYKVDSDAPVSVEGESFDIEPPARDGDYLLTLIVSDGKEDRSYPYHIYNTEPPPSDDATLLSLTISDVEFTFAASTLNYDLTSAALDNGVNSVTVRAVVNHSRAVLSINGGGTQSGADVPFYLTKTGLSAADANEITVVVTPEKEGAAVKTYTVKLYRKKKSDASLKALLVEGASVAPEFSAGVFAYNNSASRLPFGTTSVLLSATPNDANAVMELDVGEGAFTILSGASNDVPLLNYGETVNTATVKVTAEDGTTSKTYTVTLHRNNPPPNSNAKLSGITVKTASGAAVTLTPVFDGATYTYSSQTPVENSVDSVTVSASVAASTSTIKINSVAADNSGVAGTAVELKNTGSANANTISIVVTAENGGEEVYTIKIYRKPSSDANLSALTLTNPAVTFAFASGTTNYDLNNEAQKTANSTISVTVTPVAAHPSAKIKVGVNTVASGVGSVAPLNVIGTAGNTISVTVTAEDGTTTKTYTLKVYRKYSDDATLSSLSVSGGGLVVTGFNPSGLSYNLNLNSNPLPYKVGSITVTPVANNGNATIKITNIAAISGAPYTWNFTGAGSTTTQINLAIVVTAQDGVTKKTYTLNLWRERKLSDNTNITAITSTIGGKKDETVRVTPVASGSITEYTIYMADVSKAVSFGVTAQDVNAAVFINPNNSVLKYTGTASDWAEVALNPAVSITVTAEDGETQKVYKIAKLVKTPSSLTKVPMAKGGSITFVGEDEVHEFYNTTRGEGLNADLEFIRDLPSADGWILVLGGGGDGGLKLTKSDIDYSGGGGGGGGQVVEKKDFKWREGELKYGIHAGGGGDSNQRIYNLWYGTNTDFSGRAGDRSSFDTHKFYNDTWTYGVEADAGNPGFNGENFYYEDGTNGGGKKFSITFFSDTTGSIQSGQGKGGAKAGTYSIYPVTDTIEWSQGYSYYGTYFIKSGGMGGAGGFGTWATGYMIGGGGGGGAGGDGSDGEKGWAGEQQGGSGGSGVTSSITGKAVEYGKGGKGGKSHSSAADNGQGGNSEVLTEKDKDSDNYRKAGNGRVIVRFKWKAF
jgi:hypothetical protein